MILGDYDVAVIGGGHAGCEAALATARLGMRTVMFSISLDAIGNLPCNPSIGGTAKGHLVREIDALGGEMGKAADATFIQSKMLNRGKGPAVHSLRAQIDRKKYHAEMKKRLENQKNLQIKQAEIVDILTEDNKVTGVVTHMGAEYTVRAVIVASGTYLKGKILIGSYSRESGPDGMFPANELSENLRRIGVELTRFKTGTPARIHADTLNYDKMEIEEGDEKIVPFSFETEETGKNLVPCYIVYTNEKTHEIIRNNLDRSAMYGGLVEGIGPRYCPSIEDKVVRFADKKRHQLFIEPMGLDTKEMYAQGFSTSLPEDVQIEMYRSVEGLENVEIMRSAYAIEYDCCDPQQLNATLEFKNISGLYGAGQFNGTSGYEEAAAQGLIAGINAALKLKGEEPLTLKRSDGYIGTLIDDLITKGTNEPYRMMTSRS
ncbi:MAG: tRNA uridine-5-carboxymethylaminomethyl(34) synthesis enzyme MnmG, partial [Clostridia bacterium]|nr:tRNA uridine-5-carboxymethylaminomethyl(34) synthesis enzyme MnmG [Clostridia bacterium]